jgi:hypothetical protein
MHDIRACTTTVCGIVSLQNDFIYVPSVADEVR